MEELRNKYIPARGNIAVKLLPKKEVKNNGIYLPEINKEIISKGIVVAVGPEKYTATGDTIHMECKIGDIVCFDLRNAPPIEMNLNTGFVSVYVFDEDVVLVRIPDDSGELN